MIAQRHCSKPGCSRSAVATLTYDYKDSTVVVGPLATVADPNSYDLCDEHAQHLTAPLGWQVVRLATNFEPAPPSGDDLLALVDAVRRAADTPPEPPAPKTQDAPRGPFASSSVTTPEAFARRRAHFTVVDGNDEAEAQEEDNKNES